MIYESLSIILPNVNLLLTPQFPDLTSFLLARASRSTQLANYFYWYLSVECTEGRDRLKYEKIRLKFLESLKSVSNKTEGSMWGTYSQSVCAQEGPSCKPR